MSYGTADTFPSPLLCNRFFIDFPIVIKELKENPGKLGIGQTGCGGSGGMAALEGLVAGIEVCPIFNLIAPSDSPPSSLTICATIL